MTFLLKHSPYGWDNSILSFFPSFCPLILNLQPIYPSWDSSWSCSTLQCVSSKQSEVPFIFLFTFFWGHHHWYVVINSFSEITVLSSRLSTISGSSFSISGLLCSQFNSSFLPVEIYFLVLSTGEGCLREGEKAPLFNYISYTQSIIKFYHPPSKSPEFHASSLPWCCLHLGRTHHFSPNYYCDFLYWPLFL